MLFIRVKIFMIDYNVLLCSKLRGVIGGAIMTIVFTEFLEQLTSNPALLITVILVLGVILVNGWTDAPNAIATCVSTRSISPRNAIIMAAVFNFLGVFVMTMVSKAVAQTIYKMVDFGDDPKVALIALCAALFAIVVWATAAWAFGIPTSESHALIAGVSGAAIALQGGQGINGNEWIKVIYGLFLSSILGFGIGYLVTKIINFICKNMDKRKTNKFFEKAQIAGGAAMAFMHGAQDGQKFMGVFMLGVFLAKGQGNITEFNIPYWLMILCSVVMALGTSIGGYKIIKTVGMGMVKLGKPQGFGADLAGAICLFLASSLGIPVSTTHTKTTAIMGVGAAKRMSSVNWSVVKEMVFAWILTFPGCGLLGFIMSYIFMKIF
jgi:PiT family inorganic phosphate transporter